MKMKLLTSTSAVLSAALLFGNLTNVSADDSSTIQSPLQNTGFDSNASGSLTASFKAKNSQFSINAAGLTPGNIYTVDVGGVTEGLLTADSKGRIKAQFTTPSKKNSLPLDFDPHGQLVSLLDGTNSVLAAVVSGSGESSGIIMDERVTLSALTGSGQAFLRYRVDKNNVRTFSIQLKNITGANWSLFVGGGFRVSIPTQKSEGQIVFVSNGTPVLDFDPRGEVIDIVQDTNLVFSGKLEAQIQNVSVATPSVKIGSIPSTGADPDGTASARLRIDNAAVRGFSVELKDIPAGDYEFLADGILQGVVSVVANGSETEGEIEFSSRPDDSNELPLSFNPTNTQFTVQQSNIVFFQGPLVFSSVTSNQAPQLIEEALASTGLVPAAHGSASFEIDDKGREKFSVEVEDVAIGTYELWIGGVQRGSINAQLVSSEVKGEIQFSMPADSGEQPLTFDPRGQLLEVKDAAGTLFSQIFGTGDTNTVTVPLEIELPLFNIGSLTNASAQMKFKQDDRNRQSFEVEIEDAPAGDYQLLVNGILQATITVSSVSGELRGSVRFESEGDDGSLPLNFNPLGTDVVIAQNGVTLFERTLPAQ